MKLKIYGLIILLVLFGGRELFSVELIYKDKNGVKHYECEKPGVVGIARVVKVKKDQHRVLARYFSGIINSSDPHYSAQIGCGEIKINLDADQ
ncbi:MAG: hypothetical protein OEY59_02805 [Deltaproteobacteria bacterium]|nr:hypothetical protein [Deltaproteobacteria bacterium]